VYPSVRATIVAEGNRRESRNRPVSRHLLPETPHVAIRNFFIAVGRARGGAERNVLPRHRLHPELGSCGGGVVWLGGVQVRLRAPVGAAPTAPSRPRTRAHGRVCGDAASAQGHALRGGGGGGRKEGQGGQAGGPQPADSAGEWLCDPLFNFNTQLAAQLATWP
jgi:hypothetical protein